MTPLEVRLVADLVQLAQYNRWDDHWTDVPAIVAQLPPEVRDELNRREREHAERAAEFIRDSVRRW